MVWRAAAAIELGICQAVLCAIPANYLTPMSRDSAPPPGDALYFGASSYRYGSPQAEFEIPYGYLGQNGPYAQVAQMYAAANGYDERAMAKIVVDQRVNANHTPGAVFKDKPLTIADVLDSPIIASPLHMLEIVMPCMGGSAVLVTNDRWRARAATGRCGSRVSASACPTSRRCTPPIRCRPRWSRSPRPAFGMAGLTPAEMDMVSIYDCYTITALLTLEDAGFCEKGKGMQFVTGHDLTFRGDFPMNTAADNSATDSPVTPAACTTSATPPAS